MRIIDGDELIECISREDVDTREKIINLIKNQPTIKSMNKDEFYDKLVNEYKKGYRDGFTDGSTHSPQYTSPWFPSEITCKG